VWGGIADINGSIPDSEFIPGLTTETLVKYKINECACGLWISGESTKWFAIMAVALLDDSLVLRAATTTRLSPVSCFAKVLCGYHNINMWSNPGRPAPTAGSHNSWNCNGLSILPYRTQYSSIKPPQEPEVIRYRVLKFRTVTSRSSSPAGLTTSQARLPYESCSISRDVSLLLLQKMFSNNICIDLDIEGDLAVLRLITGHSIRRALSCIGHSVGKGEPQTI
jgi:hypothetical protein